MSALSLNNHPQESRLDIQKPKEENLKEYLLCAIKPMYALTAFTLGVHISPTIKMAHLKGVSRPIQIFTTQIHIKKCLKIMTNLHDISQQTLIYYSQVSMDFSIIGYKQSRKANPDIPNDIEVSKI